MQLKNLLEADEFEETHGSLDRTVDGLWNQPYVRTYRETYLIGPMYGNISHFIPHKRRYYLPAVLLSTEISIKLGPFGEGVNLQTVRLNWG